MNHRHLVAILLLGAVLPAAPAAADGPASDEQVRTAKAHLEEAYADGNDEEIVDAIGEARGLPDPDVIALVAKGLGTKKLAVVDAALRALGATDHPAALEALHDAYHRVRDRKLEGHEDLFALLLKEIGRHGDASSIQVLSDKPFKHLTYDVGLARIMGLGNIRDAKAIEALVGLSRQSGGRGPSGVASSWRGAFRQAFRTAMATLTGVDQGEVPADWDSWWRANGKGFDVPAERPEVPGEVADFWEGYWGAPYYPEGAEPAPPSLRSPIDRVENPTKEQVKEAVDGLKGAFSTRDDDEIVAALERWGGVLDPKVVHEVAQGLRSRSRTVKMAAIEVLGWRKDERALKQLHREFRRSKTKWTDDEDMFAELLQAIGRHGDRSSIEVLAESPFKALTLATGRARIYGLANIRHRDAVEALIKGMQLAGSNPPRSWRPMGEQRFSREFDLALRILTGQEIGRNRGAWIAWWKDNEKTFRVEAERPPIPEEMQRAWEEFWNEPYFSH